jgi:glycosyltransferase involved in cell wall biosynthesis
MTMGFVPIEPPAAADPAPADPSGSGPVERPYVLAACSGGYDEPLDEIAAAARALPQVEIRMTGRPERISQRLTGPTPDNLRLLGFVDADEFFRQMAGASVVLALTTREATLLSGGFEAMAFGRPFVTSDTEVLRDYFNRGTVFADHSPEGLAAAITEALDQGDRLAAEMAVLGRDQRAAWAEFAAAIKALPG